MIVQGQEGHIVCQHSI